MERVKYNDPKATEMIRKVHDAKTDADSAAGLRELNAYLVEQAWFAPWYRNKSNYASDAKPDLTPQAEDARPYLWNIKPKA